MGILLIVIKASVLLAAALLGARALRSAAAATRHALWSITFAALLALPWLGAVLPPFHVPLPAAWTTTPVGPAAGVATPASGVMPVATASEPRTPDRALRSSGIGYRLSGIGHRLSGVGYRTSAPGPRTLVLLVWLAGAVAAAGALLLSLLRVRRLTSTAADITDPAWRAAAETIGSRLAIPRPTRVLASEAVRTPMAGGVWRPLVFVPHDAASWTAERRDIVLAHELSHIARRDPLRHVAARLALACYWFHPLAWIAAKQASLAREQACDQAVLALGIRPSDYARVLLDLAETMAPRRAAAALPMVERSLLETRLMAILDHRTHPSRLRQSVVPAATAALLALTLAAAQPAARSVEVRTPAPSFAPAVRLAQPAASPAGIEPGEPAEPAPQSARQAGRDASCWTGSRGGDFSGFTNTDERGSILERVGTSDGWQIIQQRFGDLRICMLAEGGKPGDDGPSAWIGRAPRTIVETVRGATTIRLDVSRQGGAPQTTWRVNGAERPFDAAAQAWRDAVLAVLDRTWEVSTLRGEASSLHGDIASLRGEESSLRGEIASVRGEISSLRGEQASARGEESMLRGEISTIQGQMSSMRGQISSERGSISSLEASRYGLDGADRQRVAAEIKAHQDEIARLEREVRDFNEGAQVAAVEKQIRALDADGKVAALEDRIRTFDEGGKIAAIEKQIEALDVEHKSARIEKQIQALDVDRRSRQIEDRLDEAIKRLEQAMAAIR